MKKTFIIHLLLMIVFFSYGQEKTIHKIMEDINTISSQTVNANLIICESIDQSDMRTSDWYDANTIYEIRDSINLGGNTITLPVNVRFDFKGGKLSNGKLIGSNASFSNPYLAHVFDTTLTFDGTWQTTTITPLHYGAVPVDSTDVFTYDCSPAFRACLTSPFYIEVPPGNYHLSTTIKATKPKTVFCGTTAQGNYVSDYDKYNYDPHQVRIFSENNIDFVVIETGGFYWLGGVFDASQCSPRHTKNFFMYNFAGNSMWGGKLSFAARGSRDSVRINQNGTTAVYFNQDTIVTGGTGYACDIDIDCAGGQWTWLDYGVKIDQDYQPPSHGGPNYSFINSIRMNLSADGVRNLIYCLAGTDMWFGGIYQGRDIFTNELKSTPLVYLGPGVNNSYVDVFAWDMSGLPEFGYYRNTVALKNDGKNNYLTERMLYNIQQTEISGQGRYFTGTLFGTGSNLIPQTNAHGPTKLTSTARQIGMMHFDSYSNKPVWFNGFEWIDATGTQVSPFRETGVYLSDSLKAYWKFDETSGTTVFDATTNDNDGTVVGATINQTGILGKCVYFDGDDSITIVDDYSLTMNTSDAIQFSISAWVKYEETVEGREGAIVGGTAESSPTLSIVEGDTVHMRSYLNADVNTGADLIDRNEWQHIVVVNERMSNPSAIRTQIYINGELDAFGFLSGHSFDATSVINRIGMGGNGTLPFKGYIDEVGVWKRRLTIEEVLRLYNNGASRDYSTLDDYYYGN